MSARVDCDCVCLRALGSCVSEGSCVGGGVECSCMSPWICVCPCVQCVGRRVGRGLCVQAVCPSFVYMRLCVCVPEQGCCLCAH